MEYDGRSRINSVSILSLLYLSNRIILFLQRKFKRDVHVSVVNNNWWGIFVSWISRKEIQSFKELMFHEKLFVVITCFFKLHYIILDIRVNIYVYILEIELKVWLMNWNKIIIIFLLCGYNSVIRYLSRLNENAASSYRGIPRRETKDNALSITIRLIIIERYYNNCIEHGLR